MISQQVFINHPGTENCLSKVCAALDPVGSLEINDLAHEAVAEMQRINGQVAITVMTRDNGHAMIGLTDLVDDALEEFVRASAEQSDELNDISKMLSIAAHLKSLAARIERVVTERVAAQSIARAANGNPKG